MTNSTAPAVLRTYSLAFWFGETTHVQASSLEGAADQAGYDADYLYRNGTDPELAEECGAYLIFSIHGDTLVTIKAV